MGRQSDVWQSAERHPIRAWLLLAILTFVVVDGSRRTLEDDGVEPRTWPLIAFLVLGPLLGAVFAFIRANVPEGLGPSRTTLLLALAFAPVTVALGLAFAGAPVWILWLSLLLALILAAWWASDFRASGNGVE